MVGTVPYRGPLGHLLLRVHHIIRPVAPEKLGVHLTGGPGEHKGGAIFLQEGRGLQGALKVIPNGHHAQVKVPHPQGGNEGLVGAIPNLRVGHQGQNVIDPALIPVHRQNLVAQLPQLLRHLPAKPAQPNQQDRFHTIVLSLLFRARPHPTVTCSWGYWEEAPLEPAAMA